MKTEKEIKEMLKKLNALDKFDALSAKEKHGIDILLWVLDNDYKYKTKNQCQIKRK